MRWQKCYAAVVVGAWVANLVACSSSTGETTVARLDPDASASGFDVRVEAAGGKAATGSSSDGGGDVGAADGPAFSCGKLDVAVCTEHRACTTLAGRYFVSELACLDQGLTKLACVDAAIDCGAAVTWARSSATGQTWWFPSTCLPPGFERRESPGVGDCPAFQTIRLERDGGVFGGLRTGDVTLASVERLPNGTARVYATLIKVLDICEDRFTQRDAACAEEVVINLTPAQLNELSTAALSLRNHKPLKPQPRASPNLVCDPGPRTAVSVDSQSFSDCGGCCAAPDELSALSRVLERIIRESL